MSTFSSEWLTLREAADIKARNKAVADAVAGWFMQREKMSVVDLGCGTGANLRATAPMLPRHQSWTLVDNDPDLLAAARGALRAWADSSTMNGDAMVLEKAGTHLDVRFIAHNIAGGVDSLLDPAPDLVTASALFDLVSANFIKSFVRSLSQRRSAFYGALSYNGLQKWTPHRPSDSEMAAAFNRHQMSDKGFGPAAGPMAAAILADQLRLEGYNVQEGDSPWRLGQDDRTLIAELQRGHALAILELKTVEPKTVEGWVKVIRSAAEIGHTDIFAIPA